MIKKFQNLYDYVFYRSSWKGDIKAGAPVISSSLRMTLLTSTFLTHFYVYPMLIILGRKTMNTVVPPNIFKTIGFSILVLIFICHYRYYKDKFDILHERYKNESKKQRWWNGFFILITYFIVIALVVGYGFVGN